MNDLNRLIQAKFNPTGEEIRIDSTTTFRVGDRVMQTINNYDQDVMNGEVGKIVDIEKFDSEYTITVDFGDKEVEYDQITVEELVLAYAITTHKSQGSEFKCVIMAVHESQDYALNKNIIYTALTRAKEMVSIIGQRATMNESIKKIDNTIRNSKIKEKLQKAM